MSSVIRSCVLYVMCIVSIPTAHAECSTEHAAEISERLAREARHAYTWRLTWTAINGVLTLLPVGGLFVLPRRQRADLIMTAGISAVSTGFTWFWPMDVEDDAELALQVDALPEPERCARLERLLEHSTEDERDRLTWPWHVGNFVSALAPAVIVWLVFHRRTEAVLSLIGGFASGELELLTQPNALLDDSGIVSAGLSIDWAARGATIRYVARW
jgi:hypothetical protein